MCTDFECIMEKINRCKNNQENSSTTKVCKYIPSGSMSIISSFRGIENKHGSKDEVINKRAVRVI